MLNIGLIGFGKTGRIVAHEILKDDYCALKWVLRRSHSYEGDYASQLLGMHQQLGKIYSMDGMNMSRFFDEHPVDVIVDFSDASTINDYYDTLIKKKIRLISAISNYPEKELGMIKELSKHAAVLYSPNITLGINFLIVISEVLQKIMPWADIEIVEEHFRNKPDISGTAVKIANILGLDQDKHVNSVRVGGIVGKHQVIFGLPNQTIRLVHETNNRAAFGQGIIFGAKYLAEQQTGLYTMEQIIKEKFVKSLGDNSIYQTVTDKKDKILPSNT